LGVPTIDGGWVSLVLIMKVSSEDYDFASSTILANAWNRKGGGDREKIE